MESAGLSSAPSRGQGAREAYYSGDMRAARRLAASSGERWVAGLAAFRERQYPDAMGHFQAVALDPGQGEWVRAGAAYWAARSAIASGSPELAPDFLRIASRSPWTFYGLLAERQLGLEAGADPQAFALAQAGLGPTLPSPDGEIVRAAYSALSGPVLARLVKTDVRAKRAVALYQIGRAGDAGLELRAGLASARTDAQRRLWTTLALELNGPALAQAQSRRPKAFDPDDYPTPKLTPIGGFTIDKALVYAIVRQESRFDPNAVSSAGAIGLMQLMPQSAAQAAGDDKLLTDASPLYDPATNLRVGQDYVQWLMDHATGGDVLRAVAAYNGGPGSLMRAQQNVGDGDPLMLIESLPAAETRDYVEKVVAAYWVYRRMFGESARSIDSIAGGASNLPARLDR
jgi:soluble lytic murein transglycosylase-like protein